MFCYWPGIVLTRGKVSNSDVNKFSKPLPRLSNPIHEPITPIMLDSTRKFPVRRQPSALHNYRAN